MVRCPRQTRCVDEAQVIVGGVGRQEKRPIFEGGIFLIQEGGRWGLMVVGDAVSAISLARTI